MLPPVIDTHCHLTHGRFRDDLDATVQRAVDAGVARLLTIGTSVADGRAAAELAQRFAGTVHCSVGLDPFACHADGPPFAQRLAELRALLIEGRHCALGEIGLEYHHVLNPHPQQQDELAAQLDLAVELDLPVILHVRDAHHDMLPLLRRHPRNRGVVHSFIGTADQARGYLDLGYHLAFNGTVTFKANGFLRDAAKLVPNDRLLVETDAPYLAPMPLRGQRCEPAHVLHTLGLVAELRGQRPEDVAAWTTQNAVGLFRIAPLW